MSWRRRPKKNLRPPERAARLCKLAEAEVERLPGGASEKSIPVRDLCESLFKDYKFGLGLIRRNSGRSEFLIPAGAADAPDRVLSQRVVASYRDNP